MLTHEQRPSGERICFTDRPLPELIAELRAQPGGDIWICGGASIVRQLMERDLIDRYWFTLVPVLLGDGIPLFDRREGRLPLKLCSTDSANGMVDLVYDRIGKKIIDIHKSEAGLRRGRPRFCESVLGMPIRRKS